MDVKKIIRKKFKFLFHKACRLWKICHFGGDPPSIETIKYLLFVKRLQFQIDAQMNALKSGVERGESEIERIYEENVE
jgi:hypothetical protein